MLAAHGVTSMIDVSDGFTLDLSRLTRASDAGALVELERVPVHETATQAEALGGGGDYELLATLPATDAFERAGAELHERFGVSLTDVGCIIDEGLVAVEGGGAEHPLEVQGWDHFG